MFLLIVSTVAAVLGLYYLVCAFLPAIRFIDGTWDFHFSPSAMVWFLPASPRALKGRPVTCRSFLLTGGGFLAGGVAGILNYAGYLKDAFAGYVAIAAVLASLIALFLDWLDAPDVKDNSVGGTF